MMVTGEDQHGQPGVDNGQRAAGEVEGWRDLALEVAAESLVETGTALQVGERQMQGVVTAGPRLPVSRRDR